MIAVFSLKANVITFLKPGNNFIAFQNNQTGLCRTGKNRCQEKTNEDYIFTIHPNGSGFRPRLMPSNSASTLLENVRCSIGGR